MTGKFDADQPAGELLNDCWADIHKQRGIRAQLRRAKSVDEIILLPVFQRTCQRFRPLFRLEEHWEYRLAAVLGLLAHVRTTTGERLARQMAGNPPAVSELRFRRLLQKDRRELYVALIRILRMLNHRANLHDLANSVYYWGDRTKRDWAFAYFPHTPGKAPGQPA